MSRVAAALGMKGPKDLRRPGGILVLLLVLSALFKLTLPPAAQWIGQSLPFELEWDQLEFALANGALWGQLVALIAFASLSGRTWLSGYFGAIGLAAACIGLDRLQIAYFPDLVEPLEVIATGIALPPLLLIGMSPLLGLRCFRGWRIVTESDSDVARPRLSINNWLCAIAVAASEVSLARASFILLEKTPQRALMEFGSLLAPLIASSSVLALANVWLVFRTTKWLVRVLGMGGAVGIVVWAQFSLEYGHGIWMSAWNERTQTHFWNLVVESVAAFAFSWGILFAMRWCGLRFTRLARRPPTPDDGAAASRGATLAIVQVVCLLVVVAGVNAGARRVETERQQRNKQIQRLTAIVERTGGKIGVIQGQIEWLAIGPSGTDLDLAQIGPAPNIQSLKVSGRGITDAGLRSLNQFTRLRKLVVENTSVTNGGLASLPQLSQLETLDLRGGHLTGELFRRFPEELALQVLILRETPISDTDFEPLANFPQLTVLKLSGVTCNLRTLRPVSRSPRLVELSIRNSRLHGAETLDLSRIFKLDLSGSEMSEETFAALEVGESLGELSLAKTIATDRALAILAQSPNLMILNLSHTAISDAGIARLRSEAHFQLLDLRNTTITDAGLRHLASVGPYTIDLGGTRVTASGILAAGLHEVTTIRVAPKQFSAFDLSQLRQASSRVFESEEKAEPEDLDFPD